MFCTETTTNPTNPTNPQVHLEETDKHLIDELIRHTDNLTKILKSRKDTNIRYAAQGSIFSVGYWKQRYALSKVQEYITTQDTDVEDIDSAVNTLAIVSALLVTVPFSVVTAFDYEYWDWLQNVPCADTIPDMNGQSYDHYYLTQVIQQLWLSLFSSILGIGLTVFYYMLRPGDPQLFKIWWPRGRWAVFAIFVSAFIAVMITLTMAGWILNGWYVLSTDTFCDSPGNVPYSRDYATYGTLFNFLVLIFAILLMF